jgi:hypothetical protein
VRNALKVIHEHLRFEIFFRRRGVVWDREGEEGMRVYSGKGWEGRKWEGKERRQEERDDLAPKQNSWIRH